MGLCWSDLSTFVGGVLGELHELAREELLRGCSATRQTALAWLVQDGGAGSERERAAIVRHAGWMSVVLVNPRVPSAGGSRSSALLSLLRKQSAPTCWAWGAVSLTAILWCGNFGLLLLDSEHASKSSISTMLRVTCMRGAQSAGVVTYSSGSSRGDAKLRAPSRGQRQAHRPHDAAA